MIEVMEVNEKGRRGEEPTKKLGGKWPNLGKE